MSCDEQQCNIKIYNAERFKREVCLKITHAWNFLEYNIEYWFSFQFGFRNKLHKWAFISSSEYRFNFHRWVSFQQEILISLSHEVEIPVQQTEISANFFYTFCGPSEFTNESMVLILLIYLYSLMMPLEIRFWYWCCSSEFDINIFHRNDKLLISFNPP